MDGTNSASVPVSRSLAHGASLRPARRKIASPACRRVVTATLCALVGWQSAQAQIAFVDATNTAGVAYKGETYGASWGDFNGDAYPDLFANNHRTKESLFVNRGNGTFINIANQVLTWRNKPNADTHGASWADIDNDGDQDLLVSSGTGNLSQLLFNQNRNLVNLTKERGLTTTNLGGRLPVWLDYDGDKQIDFVMTQFGGTAKLYHQSTARILQGDDQRREAAVHSFPLCATHRRHQRRPRRPDVLGPGPVPTKDLQHGAHALEQGLRRHEARGVSQAGAEGRRFGRG